MIRMTDVVLLAIAVGGAIYTYQIKHEAEVSAKHLKTVNAQIDIEDRKIALLEADWALETGPARMEKLAQQYQEQLQLKQMESSQLIEISELPAIREDALPASDEVYADQNGEVLTGGIGALIERENEN